jgi:hypothetical protein
VPPLPQPRAVRGEEAAAAPVSGGASSPFHWKWVAVRRLSGGRSVINGTVAELTARGWLESDGNGRVRPTPSFPPDIARALSLIGEPAGYSER